MSVLLPGITDDSYSMGLEFVESDIPTTGSTDVEIQLKPMQEVVIQLEPNESIKLTITRGIVEIFGTELANDVTYKFSGLMKFLCFTFQGAELSIVSETMLQWEPTVADEPLMNVVLTLQLVLENQRSVVTQLNQSMSSNRMTGPKVLIIGSGNSGKSVLSRVLSSYAMRLNERQVMLCNLDPQTPSFVCPGLLTLTPISDLFNVENVNFGETETTGANFYHAKQPFCKNFGLEKFELNLELYRSVLSQLSDVVYKRLDKDLEVCNSGIIVDTPTGLSEDLVNFIVDVFKINIVIQIDSDIKLTNTDVKLININKSSNIPEKTDQYMRQIQQRSIREYFYGIDKLSLSPYTITVNYTDFKVFKPRDTTDESTQDFFVPVEINSSNINNSIMSIPTTLDKTLCRGFVCVLSCDDEKHKCKILLPTPSNSLPHGEFILTDFRYYE